MKTMNKLLTLLTLMAGLNMASAFAETTINVPSLGFSLQVDTATADAVDCSLVKLTQNSAGVKCQKEETGMYITVMRRETAPGAFRYYLYVKESEESGDYLAAVESFTSPELRVLFKAPNQGFAVELFKL